MTFVSPFPIDDCGSLDVLRRVGHPPPKAAKEQSPTASSHIALSSPGTDFPGKLART